MHFLRLHQANFSYSEYLRYPRGASDRGEFLFMENLGAAFICR